jgi:hypothetical protein
VTVVELYPVLLRGKEASDGRECVAGAMMGSCWDDDPFDCSSGRHLEKEAVTCKTCPRQLWHFIDRITDIVSSF